MTDTPTPPEAEIVPARRSPWRNLSVVWLVPLAALVISLLIAWRSYADRGTLIQITFENAAGVAAGETQVRYRDVVIGVVEEVGFTSGLENVVVSARIDKDVAPFLNDTAQFWVVRPEVSTRGVSGLNTVLSGVYIEGTWDRTGGTALTEFAGLESRPLVDVTERGTRVTLRTSDGNTLPAGSPIFYRGVEVGRTEKPQLNNSGSVVEIRAFIEAPHDRLLTTATRFWDTSGFQVSFGPSGLRLDVESFAALISGGVAFNTFFSGGRPVQAGHVYDLYSAEEDARENAFARVSGASVTLAAVFTEGVSGLSAGAELTYKGLKIGEVATLSAFVDDSERQPTVKQLVTLRVEPGLMGLDDDATAEAVLDFLAPEVEAGLRVRLAKANLLTPGLVVELAEIPDAPVAQIDRDADPYPVLPSVASELPDLNATMEGMMKRINALQIEELIAQATRMMASIDALARDDQTRAAPEAFVGLVEDARGLVGSAVVQALPGELQSAVDELRATVSGVAEARLVERLAETLDKADVAVGNIASASEQAPALMEDLRALTEKARNLEAEELVASADQLLQSLDALIDTEAARALPPTLNATLDEAKTLLTRLSEGKAVDNANAALESARGAAEALEEAAQGLPQLSARLDSLVSRSEALIGAYGDRSEFNRETLGMLREVRTAARSLADLVRMLERNPNSILFGR